MPLYEAWDAVKEKVNLEKAAGRVSGEFINLYPPGIPILAPGEVVSGEIITQLKGYLDKKMNLQGVDISENGGGIISVLS